MKQGSCGWLTRRTDRIILGCLLDISVGRRSGGAEMLLSNSLRRRVGQRKKPRTIWGVGPLFGRALERPPSRDGESLCMCGAQSDARIAAHGSFDHPLLTRHKVEPHLHRIGAGWLRAHIRHTHDHNKSLDPKYIHVVCRSVVTPTYSRCTAKHPRPSTTSSSEVQLMSKDVKRRNLEPDEIDVYDHVASAVLGRVRLVRTNLLPPAADGMTVGRFIFLRGERIQDRSTTLLAHELVHVRQFAELGPVRFFSQYLGAYFKNVWKLRNHRAAYLAIPLEQEAREAASSWASKQRDGKRIEKSADGDAD